MISSEVQKPFKNIGGHSSVLDIYAEDGNNTRYNIEIQSSPGAGRYYSSLIDSNVLPKGTDYTGLPEVYVIFFNAGDYYAEGLPMYTIERTVRELGGREFGDRSHIIYVNGSFSGDTPLGRLIHDLSA